MSMIYSSPPSPRVHLLCTDARLTRMLTWLLDRMHVLVQPISSRTEAKGACVLLWDLEHPTCQEKDALSPGACTDVLTCICWSSREQDALTATSRGFSRAPLPGLNANVPYAVKAVVSEKNIDAQEDFMQAPPHKTPAAAFFLHRPFPLEAFEAAVRSCLHAASTIIADTASVSASVALTPGVSTVESVHSETVLPGMPPLVKPMSVTPVVTSNAVFSDVSVEKNGAKLPTSGTASLYTPRSADTISPLPRDATIPVAMMLISAENSTPPASTAAVDGKVGTAGKASAAGYVHILDREGERRVSLSLQEWRILCCLYQHKGAIVPRETLLDLMGSSGNSVEVYICHLRKKLETPSGSRLILTVRGKGYRLTDVLFKEA